MSSHAAVCTQVHVPTGVTQSIVAYLCHSRIAGGQHDQPDTKRRPPNLVVARSSALEVYAVRELGQGNCKLDVVHTVRLFGVIESMAVLPSRASGGRDALLLTFRDAKISVLQWDPDMHDLKVTGLHYFEGDESLKAGREVFPQPPCVVADPQGRCAAVIMFRHQMAVLPAMESEEAIFGMLPEDEEAGAAHGAIGNSYVDNLAKVGIREVMDAVFLHGYSEPVLLLLHESEPTWEGNLRIRKDTCVLTALSLNLSAKRHPKIWSVQNLPSDAYRISAAPCGGALVFTPGLILYYTQGHQTGVAVNPFEVPPPVPPPSMQFNPAVELPNVTAARYGREHALDVHPETAPSALSYCDTTTYTSLKVACDGVHVTWLDSVTALCGLRSGQLLLVQLSERIVGATGRSIRVALTGLAPTTASLSTFPSSDDLKTHPRRVFLGSIAGDSLLLEASFNTSTTSTKMDEDEPDAKRLKSEEAAEDDYSLYGLDSVDQSESTGFNKGLKCKLRVLDTFTGCGPIRALVTGPSVGGQTPYVLACTGEGKSGALIVLRQSIVPEIITEVPLPGVQGVWAVQYNKTGSEAPTTGQYHSYLLLSFENGTTKVLATGDELAEITEKVEFATDVATLAAGSMAQGKRIVQVFKEGVRVLDGDRMLQDFWAKDLVGAATSDNQQQATIQGAHITDSYLLLLFSSGSICLLHATPDGNVQKLGNAALEGVQGITAACLYEDLCGWLGAQLGHTTESTQPSVYCAVATSNGNLALWHLSNDGGSGSPDWECSGFGAGNQLLASNGPNTPSTNIITDLKIESFANIGAYRPELSGAKSTDAPLVETPVLVALTNTNTALLYKAVKPLAASGHKLHFARLRVENLPPILPPSTASSAVGNSRVARLMRFDGLGEHIAHSGIFIAGAHPVWLVASRGTLKSHPLKLPAGVDSIGFTPFNNPSCPYGFITACRGSRNCIQISMLPDKVKLDGSWPHRKIVLKATPFHACLYAEAQLFAVAVERQVPYKPFLPEEDGGEPIASFSYGVLDGVAKTTNSLNQHEIRLMDHNAGFATVWRHSLLPGEHVVTVVPVHLKDTASGNTVPLLAVGSGFLAGEDYPCSGRVLLFEITKGGSDNKTWTARQVYQREFKGPVMGMGTTLEGALLLATGNRLEVCTLASFTVTNQGGGDAALQSNISYKLNRTAFYDGAMLVTALQVQPIKSSSVIMMADCHHSVHFLRYVEQGKQLKLLGRDYGNMAVEKASFCSAAGALHTVAGDGAGTLHAFTYDPKDPASGQGNRLVPWGIFHIGDKVSAMAREKMYTPEHEVQLPKPPMRQTILFGTATGGMGALAPLAVPPMKQHGADAPQPALLALRALQQELMVALPHGAGLHPGAFRRRYTKLPLRMQGSAPFTKHLNYNTQGILDGDLLMSFMRLSLPQQQQVVQRAGLVYDEVVKALDIIFTSCMVY